MPYLNYDGDRLYVMPDTELDAQAESIAEASVQRYLTKRSQWLCQDCAGIVTADFQARGLCDGCGETRWVTHTVRSPKPRTEAHAS